MNIHLIGSRSLSFRKLSSLFKTWLPAIALGGAVTAVGVFEYKDSSGPVHATTAQLMGVRFIKEEKKTNYGPKGISWSSTVPARRLAYFSLENGETLEVAVGPETFKKFEQLMATGQNNTTEFDATYKIGQVLKKVRDVDVQVTSARPISPISASKPQP